MHPSALMHLSSVMPPASCGPAARLRFAPLRLHSGPLRLLLLGLLLFVLATPLCAAATTWYVSLTGNDLNNTGTQAASPFLTIQTAINNASSGDTITLAPTQAAGPYYTGKGDVDLAFGGKSLTISSASGDPATTIIDCGGSSTGSPPTLHRAFYFGTSGDGAIISGLTIQHCYENTNYGGGAVSIASGITVTLMRCNFSGNTNASYNGGGAGVSSSGTVTLTGCNFSNDTTSSGGGGVSSSGTATLTGCNFTSNTASSGGGVSVSGTATLTDCNFTSNTASSGGGVYGAAVLTGCNFYNNAASNGGGFYANGNYSTVTLMNCTLGSSAATKNTASQNGGGFYNGAYQGTVKLSGCTINNNTASSGGGVYGGSMTLTGCTVAGNSASNGSGGGVYGSGTETLINCLVANNTVTNGNGGGVYNSGGSSSAPGLLQFCTIAHNSVSGTNTQGGALENDGTVTLADDILWGNTAPFEAGIGFIATNNQVTTVTSSDIQGGLSGNLNKDPLFVSPVSEFHLTAGSPCLHTGVLITGITTDLDGNTRASPPSMGAYENVGLPITNGNTTLASSVNPSVVGQSVTFTATVTVVSGNPALAGTVQFTIDGANVNGPVPLTGSGKATATATTSSLAAGGHPVTAIFTPTNAYTGPTSAALTQVVNVPVTVGAMTLVSSLNPSLVGQSVTYSAVIAVTSGSPALAGAVQFTVDGANLGGPVTVNASGGHATASAATSGLTVGTHSVTAAFASTNAYTGDTSATVSQVVTAISHTHLLWNNTDGRVMLWSIAQDGTFSLHGFGPYTDNGANNKWSATAVATGTDGRSHLLWNNTDGRVMLWTVDDAGNFTLAGYGPYTDNAPQNKWSATAVSVGPDNVVHLLWNNTDHRVMLWGVAADFSFTLAGYGPYTDNGANNLWSATALATGPDNLSHIAWNNTDGRVMLWNVDPSFSFTLAGFGPYTDGASQNLWSATGVSVGPDNLTHLLWSNTDRRAMFWNVDGSYNFTQAGYGPYTDQTPQQLWSAIGAATGPDGLSHILWGNMDYRAMLWGVDNAFNFAVAGYGPYTDNGANNLWSVTAVSAGP